jgi:cytochrome P450
MQFLALAAASVPLSAWALQRAYWHFIINSSHVTASSYLALLALAAIAVQLNLSLVRKHLFYRRARALGCGTVAVYPHKDPILGLDSFIEGLRAFNSHRLLDMYAKRFASCGTTHYINTLGSWVLMTNEVENVKTILTRIDDWPIAGPRQLAVLAVLGPDSIFTSNGAAWHKARVMMRPAFVRDQVADLACFDRHIANLLAAIPADDGKTFDMQALLLDMTMDASTDFLMGYSTNTLTTAPSPKALQFVQDFEYASRESAKKSRLGQVLFMLPHRELTEAVRRLREYVRFYIKKTAAEAETKEKERGYVFLDELLKANPPEDYAVDQILSILIAGRDTTASAITAAFYFLARHPAAVERLRCEVCAPDLDDHPTWEQLKRLKYLNNVIKEGELVHLTLY